MKMLDKRIICTNVLGTIVYIMSHQLYKPQYYSTLCVS